MGCGAEVADGGVEGFYFGFEGGDFVEGCLGGGSVGCICGGGWLGGGLGVLLGSGE